MSDIQVEPAPRHRKAPAAHTVDARSIKCTIVLDPSVVAKIPVGPSDDRIMVAVRVAGRTITADLSGKSARRARTAIQQHGAEGVAAMLQGKLLEGDVLAEAGLSVQPKTPPALPAATERS